MTDLKDIENKLEDIRQEINALNDNLEVIAEFFEKWKDFDVDRPSLYVQADVSTQEA